MPNRQYIPSGGRWPLWADHFWSHVHEAWMALVGVGFGVLVILGVEDIGQLPVALRDVPRWQVLGIAGCAAIGGAVNIYATLAEFRDRTTYWWVKRTALVAEIAGYAAFGVIAFMIRPQSVIGWYFGFALALFKVLSMTRTLIDEYRIRRERFNVPPVRDDWYPTRSVPGNINVHYTTYTPPPVPLRPDRIHDDEERTHESG